ncbi:MAG: cell division protein FtsW [Lachnospiraceae bacterium]|jgi:cell division protein FtsW|uniref:FtsW/RodA/SpoVE family cell cycle protein n=1 Tax=Candidatus Merdisoma sp. JLR.KK011 TaxID=3114299 RepID=UPI001433DFAA|nr:cell division protein FtsW [Lachnospiraceae bacterium]MCI9252382.1 cell division protein FtsW [Lachnospiraceae bacterium]MCI9384017.1 cell division protein FtsW [Lachnospiraceae bacterium]MCI9478167.1 cell division protein FtsW [Lachnospiraceae bacterium]MCI9623547.1 cell division protein FtsW [Lachnospiraceae bacterium]
MAGRETAKKAKKQGREPFDYGLMLCVLILVVFGLVVLYSTSAYNGRVKFADSAYYLKKQFFATSLGLAAMYGVSKIDYHKWERLAWLGYLVSILLSTAVLFFGDEYNGSKRWLSLGPLSFQPSEFAKVAVILLLASVISRRVRKMKSLKQMFLVMLLILPIVGLVGTNNLSTAIIIMGIAVILVFVASPKYLQFVAMGGLGVGFLAIFLSVESYRLERLAIWRNPEAYEKGYQTLQGLYAIGSGGLFGVGYGQSMQKLGFVPEAQNDMIFSIICEEFGLVGAALLMLLFLLMGWRLLMIAVHVTDLFGCMIAVGIMGHILIQVILNIAVVTNTIPNTGITLPFISYGGTSVLFLLSEMGLALNVSRHVTK